MTSTQFIRIQTFRSSSQLHSSPHRPHTPQQYPSPSTRKFSLSSASSRIDNGAVSTMVNIDALWISPSPTSGLASPDSEDNEIIANGHPISPATTFPISACTGMSLEDEDTDFGRHGIPRTQSFDTTVFDIRRVPPEQIATQITLLDLKKFKAINPKELRGCNWNKKEKLELAPNIVAFTQQFNHTAFLVMREILNEEIEKARSEIISQFIKIAKKLYEINNLHSLKAVISALQSTPIHRLSLTWRHVPRKDKSTFEKIEELLSADENWKILRDHMSAHKLPCIPDLSLFLTDLCFLQNKPNNTALVESTINVVCYFQNSTYDSYEEEVHVQKYLTRARYIDELQKFYEDDNYKLSLKYEPLTHLTPDLPVAAAAARSPVPPRGARFAKHPGSSKLRSSRSCEEGLNTEEGEEEEEGDDQESPYDISQRNSYTRRSLNTNSKGNIKNVLLGSKLKGAGRQQQSMFKHKHSVPTLGQPVTREEQFSTSVDTKKLASIGSPSSSPFPRLKPRSSSDWASDEMRSKDLKKDARVPSLSGLDSSSNPSSSTSGSHIIPPLLAPLYLFSVSSSSPSSSPSSTHSGLPQKHFPGPPPSPLLAARKRGHKKSHSLGTNVLSKFGVAKTSPPERSRRYSPEPTPVMMSLIDDSLLSDNFPVTPTDSIGNASTSGGSSHCSVEDLTGDDGDSTSSLCSDIIKKGTLRKKDVRHKGLTVSQFKSRSKCVMELSSDKIIFTDLKGKKLGKQVTVVMLCCCQLKHRDPREHLSDKQFIINDDDGNSTKFTGKSVKEAMEWVVAIKEAIRVQEEREREEAERLLIKL